MFVDCLFGLGKYLPAKLRWLVDKQELWVMGHTCRALNKTFQTQ